ncbi:hypothetical protein CB1_000568008 [Camelus ferus]|nr:hypothetical protein CB1_000568008 [Camelus ferus]
MAGAAQAQWIAHVVGYMALLALLYKVGGAFLRATVEVGVLRSVMNACQGYLQRSPACLNPSSCQASSTCSTGVHADARAIANVLVENCTPAPRSARRLTEPPEEVRPKTSLGGDGGAAVFSGARARPAMGPAASVKGALLSLVTRSLARSRAGCGRSRWRKPCAWDAERQRMDLLREGTSLTIQASRGG